MRTTITIFSTLLLFCVYPVTYGQSNKQLILDIREEFNRINSNKDLRTITLNNEEFLDQMKDGGGRLTGYFENDVLVKITVWVGLSYGSNETDYYLKNGEFFFAYQRENKFADKLNENGEFIGIDHSHHKTLFEGRYYFNSKELIKEIEEGDRIFSREFELQRFLNYANELAELLRRKNEN